MSEGTPGEGITAHLVHTPKGLAVARVITTPRRLDRALDEAKETLLQAKNRHAKIERFFGAVAGTLADGRNCVVHLSKYIPGRQLQDIDFANWSRARRVRLASKAIKLVYENHRRNVLHGHLHHRNIILKENENPELIDATLMKVIGEDPGPGNDPNGFRQSGTSFKLLDLSTFTRNALHPDIRDRPDAAPLLKDEGELREALEKAGYELPSLTLDEIMEHLHEYHLHPY